MANLLSANDYLQFNQATQVDLKDTFLKNDIIYHLAGQIYDRFMEDNDEQEFTSVNLKCLIVDSDSTKAENKFSQMGRTDMSEHYVLINFDQLRENNLVDANDELLIQADADYLTVRGERYEVISIVQIADFGDFKTYVKIAYRDNIRPKK
jgi:hypothetical protein